VSDGGGCVIVEMLINGKLYVLKVGKFDEDSALDKTPTVLRGERALVDAAFVAGLGSALEANLAERLKFGKHKKNIATRPLRCPEQESETGCVTERSW